MGARSLTKPIEADLAQTISDQADASNPELSVWVSANAGTGKTHVLTMRVLRLLLAGTRPEAILCLTYTKAAAAEMSKRVFNALSKWVTMPEATLAAALTTLMSRRPSAEEAARARTLFALAIETPGGLKIQTIHSFAEQILQRFPLEAGVAPGFAILDEEEAAALRRQSVDATLAAATRRLDSALGRALTVAVAYAADDRFDQILASAINKRASVEAASRLGFDRVEALLRETFGIAPSATRDSIEVEMASLIDDRALERLETVLRGGSSTDISNAAHISEARRAVSPSGRARALGRYFLTGESEPRKSLMTKPLRTAHAGLDAALTTAQLRYYALANERTAVNAIDATLALYRLADDILSRYMDAKARRAALDFDDLIAKSASLLRTQESAEWVLYKLDSGLAHILVDESQDTAPSQWKIIEALAGEFFSGTGARDEVRTVFAVGDEKQSIYSFQGAEAEQFARMGRHFTRLASDGGVRWRSVPLTLSFRTVEPVLAAVDAVFADPARAPGVGASSARIVHQARRIGQAGLVEVWPTITYTPPANADPWLPLAEKSQQSPVVKLAGKIADTIKRWLDEGERLPSQNRKIEPGDILILVRKREPLSGPMTAALKARNIPVAGSDRIRLIEHIAVQDLMALGDFLTLPEDDLALACVLKSPLFGLDDDDLIALAPMRKGTLWKALLNGANEHPRFAAAAETLKSWRASADFMPPYEFFATLLEKGGMRAKLVGRLGPDAAEAVDEFVDLALTYDDSAPPSLSGFLHWLRESAREIKRDMDHGRNEVRVMTVHGAKGLEAGIVILPDTCTTASAGSQGGQLLELAGLMPPGTPELFAWCVKGSSRLAPIAGAKATADRLETEERNRLLYVAMTRARDRLYVAGFEGRNGRTAGCWYELVHDALAPIAASIPQADGGPILRLEAPQAAPAEPPRGSEHASIPPLPLPSWAQRPAPREPQLAVPLAPSRLAPYEVDEDGDPTPQPQRRDPLAEPAAEPPAAASSAEQSRFLRGTLTHALLQHLPGIERRARQAAAQAFVDARAGALSARSRASIVRETLLVLDTPDFAPLFGPGAQAEVPIIASIPRPMGSGPALKLTGQIDRLADTGKDVLIVDYKTNRPAPSEPRSVADVYLYQLAAYRMAVSQIFKGKPVRAAILWTATPKLMEIPAEMLDDYAARLWTLDPNRLDG